MIFIYFNQSDILKIVFQILIIIIIVNTPYNKFDDINIDTFEEKIKFKNFLPKINFNDSSIPNIKEILESRELYIGDTKLTKDYINYIRPINLNKKNTLFINKTYEGIEPDLSFTKNRKKQIKMEDFYELCQKEKIFVNKFFHKKIKNPVISILVISYNKKNMILKSIRSIQNQSLKNIEIIIVNDNSTDNNREIFNKLLKSDKRIRIFTHLKNMGAWRSRLDAFLYSNAPYVIHFDAGDFYSDNYVLEDIYNLVKKFNLDSLRFGFRLTKAKKHLSKKDKFYLFSEEDRKIKYGNRAYNVKGFMYGTIWNRLTKADIFIKGLNHLDNYILNAYKNIYEDR